MQMWLYQNQKLFGLKCFFKCVKQFGCGNYDFFSFLNLIVYLFHCDHGHLNITVIARTKDGT